MKPVHVECKPDELLLSKLGFQRKLITHHQGKSRVFHALGTKQDQLAVVDENPGSAKTRYEEALQFIAESEGIKFYKDKSGNKIFILKGKLEDWIVSVCKQYKVDLPTSLPARPNALHEVINQRLQNFGELLDHLIETKNPAILKLKTWLHKK